MTGWEPKGNESSFPVWKPDPKQQATAPAPQPVQQYWPFPKVDFETGEA